MSAFPPTYIVLPSNAIVQHFRTQVKISQRNFEELLTQVFERFMHQGLDKPVTLSPRMTMLIMEPDLAANHPDALHRAFEQLCHDLRDCLRSLGLKVILHMDHGFNYCFASLRGDSIVIQHLSDDETRVRPAP